MCYIVVSIKLVTVILTVGVRIKNLTSLHQDFNGSCFVCFFIQKKKQKYTVSLALKIYIY